MYEFRDPDAVKLIWMYVFTKLQLNPVIPSERFHLSVAGPVVVVKDDPQIPGKPPGFVASTGVGNAAALRDSPKFERQPSYERTELTAAPGDSRFPWLLITNAVALLGVVAWIWLRRQRT